MKKPHYEVTAGIILKKEKVLIALRPKAGHFGGLWEFPGGKRKDEESLEACLAREINEELGIHISVDKPFMVVKQSYPEFHITLHAFLCTHLRGDPKPIGCEDFRWVKIGKLNSFSFPEADKKIVEALAYI
ncbi:MAG TPA: (deoxy)nucleoside triphosphate pyrophosphohydrolase [Syntrophaceae bacterium]|nr:(deoxy)nucleoside triphosphate pyrophosphohydrolase [Syntrophaceae bacterium]